MYIYVYNYNEKSHDLLVQLEFKKITSILELNHDQFLKKNELF